MATPAEELKESRGLLLKKFREGTVSDSLQEHYTEIVDQYFRRTLQENEAGHKLFRKKKRFAFVAVGGYGRKELCIQSDIDIIILFRSKLPSAAKELSDSIFFPLWDLGLDLGYGIRTIRDCLDLGRDDFGVLTSLMDARFLCGDSPVYLSLMEDLQKKVLSKKAKAFGRWLEEQDKIRMSQYGDASHLLEPHLKEGIGGLRDYHYILWLSRALFNSMTPRDLEYDGRLSHHEYRELKGHLHFLWLVRNHLHESSGRKNDRLSFEYQEKIASDLGYKDKENILGVEQFMGELHASMAFIKSLHRSFFNSCLPKSKAYKKGLQRGTVPAGLQIHNGEIIFDSAKAILSDPILLMDAFYQSSVLDVPLSQEARRLIREFLYLVDDNFKSSKRAVQLFLGVIRVSHNSDTLDQMLETGLLEAFLPEFKKIKDLVQFDAYHIFPVGRHSIETLRHLKGLKGQKEILLTDIFSDLKDPEPLFLAALLHDIGKSGENHALRGVSITRSILERFNYDGKRSEDILFLVENHLLLAETATRRDLNDEKAVVQCARIIGGIQRLKMLYLLTWADSMATGPRAWNDWTSNLVQELFFKIYHIFERKELATPGASKKVKQTRSEVLRLMKSRGHDADLDRLFEIMPPRYILNTSPFDILRHVSMYREFKGRQENDGSYEFLFQAGEDAAQGCWEATFMAGDRHGLFSDMAGVLALNNINILSAEIYTWRDQTAVDIFKITGPVDPINPDKTWKRVKEDLRKIFNGKLALEYRLDQKRAPSLFSNNDTPAHPPHVAVDNKSSDFFTLIEIFADDRVGLCYSITRTLFHLRIDIKIAKIATKGDQAADVFYVRDFEGQKVKDGEQVAEIKRALLHTLRRIGSQPVQ